MPLSPPPPLPSGELGHDRTHFLGGEITALCTHGVFWLRGNTRKSGARWGWGRSQLGTKVYLLLESRMEIIPPLPNSADIYKKWVTENKAWRICDVMGSSCESDLGKRGREKDFAFIGWRCRNICAWVFRRVSASELKSVIFVLLISRCFSTNMRSSPKTNHL